jgi:hypothetical protein
MEAVLTVLTVLVIALLWAAAVVFGRDSRQGGDWTSAPGLRDRSPRLGD